MHTCKKKKEIILRMSRSPCATLTMIIVTMTETVTITKMMTMMMTLVVSRRLLD